MTIKISLCHRETLTDLQRKGGGASTFELAEAAMKDPDNLLVAMEFTPAAAFSALGPAHAHVLKKHLVHHARSIFEMRVKKHGIDKALERADAMGAMASQILITEQDAPMVTRARPGIQVTMASLDDIERARTADDLRIIDDKNAQMVDADLLVVAMLIKPASSFIGMESEEAAELADALVKRAQFIEGLQKVKLRFPGKLS